jgi:L-threonylcarbamoyladenylate synthase
MPDCKSSAPDADVARAAQVLASGGTVVYPTETLYGLGVDAFSKSALDRLLALKVREAGKPISVLVDSREMLDELVESVPDAAAGLIERYWPGPLTLVFAARGDLGVALTAGSGSIGVRISSHPVAQALVATLGRPLTSPSANPAGAAPPQRIEVAHAYFGDAVDCYLDAGPLPGEPPSTVVDVRDGLRLLRAGAIDFETLAGSSPTSRS